MTGLGRVLRSSGLGSAEIERVSSVSNVGNAMSVTDCVCLPGQIINIVSSNKPRISRVEFYLTLVLAAFVQEGEGQHPFFYSCLDLLLLTDQLALSLQNPPSIKPFLANTTLQSRRSTSTPSPRPALPPPSRTQLLLLPPTSQITQAPLPPTLPSSLPTTFLQPSLLQLEPSALLLPPPLQLPPTLDVFRQTLGRQPYLLLLLYPPSLLNHNLTRILPRS